MHNSIVQTIVHDTTTLINITLNPNQIIITHTDDIDLNLLSHSVDLYNNIHQNKRIFLPDDEGLEVAVQHL